MLETDRLERILDHRRSAEERCQKRVRDLRERARASRGRLDELERMLSGVGQGTDCPEFAAGLAASQRYAQRLRVRVAQLRRQLQEQEERLGEARRQLEAAAQRRLAVEKLLNRHRREVRQEALAGVQRQVDEQGRLHLMRRED
jgi:flagellar export protein FliJ